jgi:hypothetical protein
LLSGKLVVTVLPSRTDSDKKFVWHARIPLRPEPFGC